MSTLFDKKYAQFYKIYSNNMPIDFHTDLLYNYSIAVVKQLIKTDWRPKMSDMNEYTPDLFTLEDEEGNSQTFELIDVYEENDNTYYALIPYQQDPAALADDDGMFVILRRDDSLEEEMLVSIDDEDELDRIGDIFMKRIEEMFDDIDEDDCCDDEDCDCH
jgi:uncharacterized protein YrzB (UPF0473 family)